MSPVLFTINFRREAYLQEVARTRRRVVALGAWVAYFGILTVVLGLYGLNCSSLASRASIIERRAARIRGTASPLDWQVSSSQLGQMERLASSTRGWRNRLWRLGELLPSNARISSLTVNPRNQSDATSQNSMVIMGELRPAEAQDRMQEIMSIVGSLRSDSLFSRGYSSITLTTTRLAENGVAEFSIECR